MKEGYQLKEGAWLLRAFGSSEASVSGEAIAETRVCSVSALWVK
jgi:hypothetical protein